MRYAEFEEQFQFVCVAGENTRHEVRDEAFDAGMSSADRGPERKFVKVFPRILELFVCDIDGMGFTIGSLVSRVPESGGQSFLGVLGGGTGLVKSGDFRMYLLQLGNLLSREITGVREQMIDEVSNFEISVGELGHDGVPPEVS